MDQETYNRKLKARKESKIRSFNRMKNRQLSKRVGYDLMDKSYNVREGVNKQSRQRTTTHETAKGKVQHLCMLLRYKSYTEIIFIDGQGIADVFIPEIMRVYEILESETDKKFTEKIKKYPPGLEIIPLKAEDVLKDDFCL